MGRDSLLKGTKEKKEKRAAPAKKGTKASTKAKKSKTEKTTRKTVKKVEKPKEIKTSKEVPEAKPKIEEKGPKSTPAQVSDVVKGTVTQTREEPEKELVQEPVEKPESHQEPVFAEPEVTMPIIQKTEKNSIWIYGGAAVLLLLLVLLTASFTNSNIFAFKQKGNTVELWGGYFAPMGMGLVKTFSDLALPADEEGKTIIKDTYTKGEAYDIVFQYFLTKADEALSRQEVPDLKEINALLEEARGYALTDSAKETVSLRKNGLRFLVLMGKVNLALARNTAEDLIAAQGHLAEIDQIAATPIQRQMAKEKASAVESALKKFSAEGKD
jgi:hypothetical protein